MDPISFELWTQYDWRTRIIITTVNAVKMEPIPIAILVFLLMSFSTFFANLRYLINSSIRIQT